MPDDPLLLARLQMAFTLGAHIVLACLGVGLPVMLLIAEGMGILRCDPSWTELDRAGAALVQGLCGALRPRGGIGHGVVI